MQIAAHAQVSKWPFATDIVLQPNVGSSGKSGSSWRALKTTLTKAAEFVPKITLLRTPLHCLEITTVASSFLRASRVPDEHLRNRRSVAWVS
jgi:hypothetical protein